MASAGGYDRTEPNGFRVNLYILITMVGVAAVFVMSIYMYKTFLSAEQDRFIESDTRAWANKYREEQKKDLSSYKWVDKSKGFVQIPIHKAIDRLAK